MDPRAIADAFDHLHESFVLVDRKGTVLASTRSAQEILSSHGVQDSLVEASPRPDALERTLTRFAGSGSPLPAALELEVDAETRSLPVQGWRGPGPDQVLLSLEGPTPALQRLRALTDRVSALDREVRARRRAEDALAEARATLENILESSTHYAIFAEDEAGRIVSWNEGARRCYGLTGDAAIGRQVASLGVDGDAGDLRRAAARAGKAEARLPQKRADDTIFPAHVVVTRRRDRYGRDQGFLSVVRDVTLEESVEAIERENRRIEQAIALRDEIIATAGRDLADPLDALVGFAEILEGGRLGATDPVHAPVLEDLLEAAHTLQGRLADLLDLARAEVGALTVDPRLVDVPELVDEAVASFRPRAAGKRVRLHVQANLSNPDVRVDPLRLSQVLHNYIANALSHTPPGGTITVRVRDKRPPALLVEVEDTGPGIPPEEVQNVFQAFARTGSDSKRAAWFGLAVTRRVVEAMGGSVDVSSQWGRGSTFHATIPLAPEEAPEAVHVIAREPLSSRVLLDADDRAERAALAAMLEEAGHTVAQRSPGAQFRVGGPPLDAVIVASNGDPATLRDRLVAVRAGLGSDRVPVVVVTDPGETVAFPVAGAITRPVGAEDLRSVLAGVLDGPGSRAVIVLEKDPRLARLLELELGDLDVPLVIVDRPEDALAQARGQVPLALVLDAGLQEADAPAFLEAFRSLPGAEAVPVLVLLPGGLDRDTVRQLRRLSHATVRREEGTAAVLARLSELLRREPSLGRIRDPKVPF